MKGIISSASISSRNRQVELITHKDTTRKEKRARFERATECLRVRGITPPCVSSCANACILAGAQLRRKGGSGGRSLEPVCR